ncbi:MAG: RNA polymerase sigma factor [Hyphomicrobiales bacterium]|nr:RNA polymerase sigma factor [Hyphomicrobiales bacterium]
MLCATAPDSGANDGSDRRICRVARGILGDDTEAEDVVQETYTKAFQNLAGFRAESSLATWLTRIAINEALGRKRRQRPMVDLSQLETIDEQGEVRVLIFPGAASGSNPEEEASRAEIRRLLAAAVDDLPEPFRIVFVMREMEQMSVEETAAQLELLPETVKTRLYRARRLLREAMQQNLGSAVKDVYAFDGLRCERVTNAVLARLGMVVRSQRIRAAASEYSRPR